MLDFKNGVDKKNELMERSKSKPCCFGGENRVVLTGKKTFFYTVFRPVKKRFFLAFLHMTD